MAVSKDGKHYVCDVPECLNRISNHLWGRVRASGWFHQKDGTAYCPEHIPSWVEAWREKKEQSDG